MEIKFEEKGHIYFVNGDIASISVTELLAKHHLAPDYSGAKKGVLKQNSAQGKEVHKDLENVLNTAKYEPKTKQGENFKKWVSKNLDCGAGEQMLAYEYNGMIICGTADVMGITKKGELLIGDHKNTAKFYEEYVSWQVSLLDYFARKINGRKINGNSFNWKGATQFKCFHYNKKTGEMKVYNLEKVPDTEIEKLIECEYKGEIYKRPVLVVNKELSEKFIEAEQMLAQLEQEYKQAKVNAEKIREQMLEVFKEQGIKSWESPNKKIKVTYVEPIDRLSVDSDKLKKEYPQVFANCQKLTKTKASIRVKVRDGEDDEY